MSEDPVIPVMVVLSALVVLLPLPICQKDSDISDMTGVPRSKDSLCSLEIRNMGRDEAEPTLRAGSGLQMVPSYLQAF